MNPTATHNYTLMLQDKILTNSTFLPKKRVIPVPWLAGIGLRCRLLALGINTDVVGVEDGVFHLVAYNCSVVERTAGSAGGCDVGTRAGPTASNQFVATAVFGVAGAEAEC